MEVSAGIIKARAAINRKGGLFVPNSGFRISYASRYYRFGADKDSAVVPDRLIELTWAEFRAGRDPVMEWIFSNAN